MIRVRLFVVVGVAVPDTGADCELSSSAVTSDVVGESVSPVSSVDCRAEADIISAASLSAACVSTPSVSQLVVPP